MLWLLPLKRYAQFSGRAGRGEYWQFVAFCIAAAIVAALIDNYLAEPGMPNGGEVPAAVKLLLVVPAYAVGFRRLHDCGRSGWLFGIVFAAAVVAGFGRGAYGQLRGSIIALPFLSLMIVGSIAAVIAIGYLIWQLCQPGDPGTNRYGPPPTDTAENAPKLNEVMAAASERVRGFAPPPSSPPPPAGTDTMLQLERLAKLHRDGVLTDEEFARQKAALLGR